MLETKLVNLMEWDILMAMVFQGHLLQELCGSWITNCSSFKGASGGFGRGKPTQCHDCSNWWQSFYFWQYVECSWDAGHWSRGLGLTSGKRRKTQGWRGQWGRKRQGNGKKVLKNGEFILLSLDWSAIYYCCGIRYEMPNPTSNNGKVAEGGKWEENVVASGKVSPSFMD